VKYILDNLKGNYNTLSSIVYYLSKSIKYIWWTPGTAAVNTICRCNHPHSLSSILAGFHQER